MDDYAQKTKKNRVVIAKDARRYLYEIAADYRETFIEIWLKTLTWLWNTVYDGLSIDSEGLAKIRNLSKKMPFVIISCHRSHIDYLLLSYVFYKNNIQMPFIAAGNNLSFFHWDSFFAAPALFSCVAVFGVTIFMEKSFPNIWPRFCTRVFRWNFSSKVAEAGPEKWLCPNMVCCR